LVSIHEPPRDRRYGVVIFYGVADARIFEILEFFASPHDAERFIEECLRDEPSWAPILSIEPIEFEIATN
jgi:hypothetical protein